MPPLSPPQCKQPHPGGPWMLSGAWVFATLDAQRQLLATLRDAKNSTWDLSGVSALDSVGAAFLWEHWGQTVPTQLHANPDQHALISAFRHVPTPPRPRRHWRQLPIAVGEAMLGLGREAGDALMLFGRIILASFYIVRHPRALPWAELSANMYRSGVSALGITALVGFLIGIVLSFLSAQQLQRYGANLLIVDLLGISILRELGPLLAAILVAGRSGSAMTAQIGVMKINQELDALSAMGLSTTLRLAWPKVMALLLVMPLLAFWTDVMALLGGMLSAMGSLKLGPVQFMDRFQEAVSLRHLWIGLGKSFAFGAIIGVTACTCGLAMQANSESLGRFTTRAVVMSITLVIIADAIFAVLLSLGSRYGG